MVVEEIVAPDLLTAMKLVRKLGFPVEVGPDSALDVDDYNVVVSGERNLKGALRTAIHLSPTKKVRIRRKAELN